MEEGISSDVKQPAQADPCQPGHSRSQIVSTNLKHPTERNITGHHLE
jgi:hypothetical protein